MVSKRAIELRLNDIITDTDIINDMRAPGPLRVVSLSLAMLDDNSPAIEVGMMVDGASLKLIDTFGHSFTLDVKE